jgi:hypothetical protein
MDRNIVYPGAIPLDSDLLTLNRNTMIALGYLAQMVLGTSTIVDGLICSPTSPASLSVTVGPGSITQLSVVDTLAFGSLAADSTDQLIKMGVNLTATTFTITPPTTSGQATNFLIQAALQEADGSPLVLPYYNASNPSQPYSGPTNSGVAQNTIRTQRVQLQLKAGAAANVGLQATPPIDNGWVGLYHHGVVRPDGRDHDVDLGLTFGTVSRLEITGPEAWIRIWRAVLRGFRQLYHTGWGVAD